jgi:glycosyltransferase involved in cell wall biosynthesis
MNVKVSVCMPNYNGARYLPEAIESVLKQRYSDFEFLIIDDCSTDGSLEIINKYAKKDPRIVVRVNDVNVGQTKNLNLCLKHARGEYIKFVFSDDVLNSSEVIERMVDILDANDDVALVSSARYLIDENSTIRGILSEYKEDFEDDGKTVITDCLFSQKNKVGEPTVAMFRKAYAARGFREQFTVNLDWEMWLHILEQGNFVYISEPLCSFRMHANSQTALNEKKPTRWFAEHFNLLRDYGSKPYVHLSRLQRTYMGYLPAFEIWRFYKKFHRISLRTALQEIQSNYGVLRFCCLYPMYKLYKMVLSVKKRISRLSKRYLYQ